MFIPLNIYNLVNYHKIIMSSPTTMAILLVIIGSLCSIILLQYATQSYCKRVRKLPPGPRPLPVIGNLYMLTTLPHCGLHNLAKKYGQIMSPQLGHVPTIFVSSPEVAELFLKTNDIFFASRPKLQVTEYMSYGTKGLAFAAYGPYWRNVRKFCTLQPLSASKIESFATLRRVEVGSLVEWLKKAAAVREVVDMNRMVGSS